MTDDEQRKEAFSQKMQSEVALLLMAQIAKQNDPIVALTVFLKAAVTLTLAAPAGLNRTQCDALWDASAIAMGHDATPTIH